MVLPTSGALSLNAIHIEAGGAANTLATINDADIRSLTPAAGKTINTGANTNIDFADFYGAYALWTPERISTRIWLDAADTSTIIKSGNSVSRWNDKSGNNNYATGVNGPLSGTNFLNGKNVIKFDYEYQRSFTLRGLTSGITASTGVSVFIMFYISEHPSYTGGGLWHAQGSSVSPYPGNHFTWSDGYVYDAFGSTTRIQVYPPVLAYPTLYQAVSRTNVRQMRWNGSNSLAYSSTSNTFSIAGTTHLGVSLWPGHQDFWHDGIVAEFIVTDGTIGTANRQRMEGYIAHKWGITSSLPNNHPYRNVHP